MKRLQGKLRGRLLRKLHGLDDRGSALLTVLLFVAFLSMLATTLMYVVGMNFIIKQADYQNKKNFYTGETALEEVRAMLMDDIVSKAAQRAYKESCMTYSTAGGGGVRELEYNEYFVDAVAEIMGDKIGSGGTWLSFLNSGYDTTYYDNTKVKFDIDKDDVLKDATGKLLDESLSGGTLWIDSLKGIVTIKGIEVTYINEDGVATIISTDLELHAPEIDWSVEQSATGLPAGVDQAAARDKKTVNVTRCVRYTNWVKK